ncbi:MAG: hypothetical protein ACOC1L_03310 [Bacillota bacterium]
MDDDDVNDVTEIVIDVAKTNRNFTPLLAALDIDAVTLLAMENLSDRLLYHVLDAAYYSYDVESNARSHSLHLKDQRLILVLKMEMHSSTMRKS